MKSILRLITVGLVTAVLTCLPVPTKGQTPSTNAVEKKAAPEKKSATEKKRPSSKKSTGEKGQRSIPFNGTLASLDTATKTITVGKRTFQITSTTRIYKGEKTPATLEDGVVGEVVRGSYKKLEDGKLVASSVYFGPKTEGKATEKTKPAEAKSAKPANQEKK